MRRGKRVERVKIGGLSTDFCLHATCGKASCALTLS